MATSSAMTISNNKDAMTMTPTYLFKENSYAVKMTFPSYWNDPQNVLVNGDMLQSAFFIVNTLRPRRNKRHFADDIFKCILLNEIVWISIKISLKFSPNGPINNIPALVQIMAWRRPGDKPLSEPMMIISLTHICVTRPQWVRGFAWKSHTFTCDFFNQIMWYSYFVHIIRDNLLGYCSHAHEWIKQNQSLLMREMMLVALQKEHSMPIYAV